MFFIQTVCAEFGVVGMGREDKDFLPSRFRTRINREFDFLIGQSQVFAFQTDGFVAVGEGVAQIDIAHAFCAVFEILLPFAFG